MPYLTRSGRPTWYHPDDPQMTDCCHSSAEWCTRYTWAEALDHALERARRSRMRQHITRKQAYENGPDDQWWSISARPHGGRRH